MIEGLRMYTWRETQRQVPTHLKDYIGVEATPHIVVRQELQMLVDGKWFPVPTVEGET